MQMNGFYRPASEHVKPFTVYSGICRSRYSQHFFIIARPQIH